jgi:hypothetical protein
MEKVIFSLDFGIYFSFLLRLKVLVNFSLDVLREKIHELDLYMICLSKNQNIKTNWVWFTRAF